MDDLYVVQQLANKVAEEAAEIGEMWKEFGEKNVETEREKAQKVEQEAR